MTWQPDLHRFHYDAEYYAAVYFVAAWLLTGLRKWNREVQAIE